MVLVTKASMINVKSVTGVCIFALILTEVTSWTIDLPDVRKYYFERNAHKHGDENKIYFNPRPDLAKYNNIEGNSRLNTLYLNDGVIGSKYDGNAKYADDYGYHTYMEKKVQNIFHKGNVYLEGLQRAMEGFAEQLENCSRLERSRPSTNASWVPELESPQRALNAQDTANVTCANATRKSEYVRRLAALAIWAAKELQDYAYAKEYDKDTKDSEEDVLLLQLAWALDELARLTGYEPDPVSYTTIRTPAPTAPTTPATFFKLPIPNDGPTNSDCIKASESTAPATVRCAVVVPAILQQLLNLTGSSPPNTNTSREMLRLLTTFNYSEAGRGAGALAGLRPDEMRTQLPRCMAGDGAADPAVCSGLAAFMRFLNTTFPEQQQFQNFQPRSNRETDASQLEILEAAEDQASVEPLRKRRTRRSPSDPLGYFSEYYMKYKSWSGANTGAAGGDPGTSAGDGFEVANDLTAVKPLRKRSFNVKDGVVVRVPENPMRDVSEYAKREPGVHYERDAAQADEIEALLEKTFHDGGDKRQVKEQERSIEAAHGRSPHRRSVQYGRAPRPREPEDPMRDISYYVKAKGGTNVRPDAANAALVRLAVRTVFERPDVAAAHRFGSNYVPGVQPLQVGALESFLDV